MASTTTYIMILRPKFPNHISIGCVQFDISNHQPDMWFSYRHLEFNMSKTEMQSIPLSDLCLLLPSLFWGRIMGESALIQLLSEVVSFILNSFFSILMPTMYMWFLLSRALSCLIVVFLCLCSQLKCSLLGKVFPDLSLTITISNITMTCQTI